MAITIVLSVFIVVLTTISLLFYLWWKKYGKKIFDMFMKLNNTTKSVPKLPNLGDFEKELLKIQDILSKNGKNLKK